MIYIIVFVVLFVLVAIIRNFFSWREYRMIFAREFLIDAMISAIFSALFAGLFVLTIPENIEDYSDFFTVSEKVEICSAKIMDGYFYYKDGYKVKTSPSAQEPYVEIRTPHYTPTEEGKFLFWFFPFDGEPNVVLVLPDDFCKDCLKSDCDGRCGWIEK